MTIVVHSSDIHVDDEAMAGALSGIAGLRAVIAVAESVRADLLLLAGDTFDNRRVAQPVLSRVVEIVRAAPMPIVLLPGNHDPALEESIFHRAGLLDLPDIHILGLTHPETIVFERHALEVSGRPHRSWADMTPLPEPGPRAARRRIVMAHGHYVAPQDWAHESHRSWLISDAHLAAIDADYIALGHWERAAAVGDGTVRAHYSGSPDTARSVNVVRLPEGGGVEVERVALKSGHGHA
ncbi:MAG: metallophosphoesterase [Alphaproteobacteria bacterium]|nr:metallophosphoesterase [Alphaproteobacteria bacterium]